jgi:glycosyltransferase involved in cell wall biosynthesis
MTPPPTVCFVPLGAEDPAALAASAALERRGWSVFRLDELPGAPGDDLQRFGGDDPTVVLGERASAALERLHAEHGFDLIEFVAAGVAMRAVQAKRSGDAFGDVPLAVRPAAPAFVRRAEEERTLGAPRELKLDFCERYAFEGADVQLASSADLLALIGRHGWRVREDAAVVPAAGAGGETDKRIENFYRELIAGPLAGPASPVASPTITVVVAHYNHDRHLAAALASLAAQTRPPDEVIVIDDGSTSEAALWVFAEQESRYPDWRFIRQENAGPGATRNRGLELAAGNYFLPFDSDNIAVETMVERLLRAMERNPGRAATSCHNFGFTADEDVTAGRFTSRYSPTGGPLVLAAVENVFGDTCSIFDTAALRSVGGFEVNLWSPTEDWETFVKIATRGLEVDVLPRPLFYYRTDAGGRLQHLGTDRATKLRLRAHLVNEFFAAAEIDEVGRRELLESLQAFDDFVQVGVEGRLAEQRRWHDSQMADIDAYRERQVEELREDLGGQVASEGTRAEAERVRAETAERELASLRRVTSGWLLRKLVRLRAR